MKECFSKEKRNKKSGNEKGITLVALVVTIIVLLILAGVSLNLILGQNGIIEKSKNSVSKYNSSAINEKEQLNEFIDKIDEEIGNIKEDDKVTLIDDGNGNKIPVPDGFDYVEGDKDSGFVIEDDDENQFVWVPVPDIAKMAKLRDGSSTDYRGILYDYGSLGWPQNPPIESTAPLNDPGYLDDTTYGDKSPSNTITGFSERSVQDEFNEMVKSVSKYKGFYMGRYEIGGLDTSKGVIKQSEHGSSIRETSWWNMYEKCKSVTQNNENVTTGMVYGCQWDAAILWMISDPATAPYILDSTGKGHYNGTDTAQTGSSPNYNMKNIYDMAGNVWEWTMTAEGTSRRVYRGGVFYGDGASYPISSYADQYPDTKRTYIGSRAQMFIK